MGIKKNRPTTPSRRNMTSSDFSEVTHRGPLKRLIRGKSNKAGHGSTGRITVRFRGGGHKRRLRLVDFRREKSDVPGAVKSIEYDPNRSANIALIAYADGEKRYILSPVGLNVGDVVVTSANCDLKPGNHMPLNSIPVGTQLHNIELRPGKGGQLARAAGTSAQLMAKEGRYAQVKLPSGEVRLVLSECFATVGQVGNAQHELIKIGKAGRSRWLGRRPHNRGVAMNPIDHPHGGGEGRTSGGRHPVTPWGKPTLGRKTRKNKRTNRFIVKHRNRK